MKDLRFDFIKPEEIEIILPLMTKVNTKTPEPILRNRIIEMSNQNYKCLGIYDAENLIGICGLWFLTRHYCGRTFEPDHVVIDEAYQSQGIGNKLFDWLFEFGKDNGYEATELNTYVNNVRSHKFYYNLGYEIRGFHFVKNLE